MSRLFGHCLRQRSATNSRINNVDPEGRSKSLAASVGMITHEGHRILLQALLLV